MDFSIFATGLDFTECPRWHEGRLWLSDMWEHAVLRFAMDGSHEVVHSFPEEEDPGGLGWLPSGELLVVGMDGRCLYRLEDGRANVMAHLESLVPWLCNDMIVSPTGVAYITQLGRRRGSTDVPQPVPLVRVDPSGIFGVAAPGLMSPNGIAITEDGRRLYVAEPGLSRAVVFDVAEDGSLGPPEVFATVTPLGGNREAGPDGICLDAEGALWWPDPTGHRLMRVEKGGRITHEHSFGAEWPVAPVLGGPDRRTLFLCVNGQVQKDGRSPDRLGRVYACEVDVPGVGRP